MDSSLAQPEPIWQGQNTQSRNIAAGIDALLDNYNEKDIEAVFIIEDDDYYRDNYLERMMTRINYKVFGEINTIYYNVFYRGYLINRNTSHVSLFQLAFSPEIIPLFKTCYNERFIDFKFFEKLHAQQFVQRGEVGMFNEGNLAIGIKGMPGRKGIGAGHNRMTGIVSDQQMTYLKSQIQDDAKFYERYYGDSSVAQHALFAQRRV